MPDDTDEDLTDAQEKTAEDTEEARKAPLSLAPLTFEEAVDGLLQVKLTPEELRPKKGSGPRKGAARD